MLTLVDLVAASALLWALRFYAASRKSCLPLPPGPPKLPLVGNLLTMPKVAEWKTYHKWCKEFNTDILHLDAAGTSIIVLDTYEAAVELFERRSSIHAGRPRLPMVVELMGWDFSFGFMNYGERWRRLRKLVHQSFHSGASKRYYPSQVKAARRLLLRCLDSPEDIVEEIRHLSGEVILSATYGFDIVSKTDKYIMMAKEGVDPILPALIPGTYLVDFIPALKYVPEWFPGAGFRRKAKEWKKLTLAMRDVPFSVVKTEIENGSEKPTLCSLSLQRIDERLDREQQERDIRDVAGTMYASGSDTTMASIANCIIALLNHPEVLKKAHKEIDRVLAPGNLPDFDDESSLPYVTAIIKETSRWNDAAPLGLPHMSLEEDEYHGYRIPKGSLVLANIWAILHDGTIYPDPFTFNPERFLTKDGKLNQDVWDPAHAIWGFGRRICPGRFLAASSTWITVASFITAFDFSRSDSTAGPDHPYLPGSLRLPLPFTCTIRPRSREIEAAICSVGADDTY